MIKKARSAIGRMSGAAAEKKNPPSFSRGSSYLGNRQEHISQLAPGEQIEKIERLVDPARCRMWVHHDRDYSLLNDVNCADLIAGLKEQGRQELPAIVRRVTDTDQYDYEVICGARRHFAVTYLRENNYPDFKYLVEERKLTDEEAFRLSDLENRAREDISDYERAKKYQYAMKQYYKTQKEMAARMEVTETWLSRYLDLTKLPMVIVKAYPVITELKCAHCRLLLPLLKDKEHKEKVLERAKALFEEQQVSIQEGKGVLSGQQVVNALVSVTKNALPSSKPETQTYKNESGAVFAKATLKANQKLQLILDLGVEVSEQDLLDACRTAVNQYRAG